MEFSLDFLWASPHTPTPEQIKELKGEIKYLKDINPELAKKLFNTPASTQELIKLANELLDFTEDKFNVILQPAGSPAFQYTLGSVANDRVGSYTHEYVPEIWYAHSERVSEDISQPDGSIKKVSVFRHVCWIKIQY